QGSFDHSSLEPDSKMKEYDAGRAWVHDFYEKSKLTADTPEDVAGAVLLAATAKRHRQRYTVGKVAWQISLLRRLMPATLFDKALRQQFRLPA
ncbi:short-chain dehydrogenase/reductase, partial [Rhizobium sp. L43]